MPPSTITDQQFRIRDATVQEVDAVGILTFQGFGHHLPGASEPDPARLELLLNAAARAREGRLLVAEDLSDGALVGTASVLPFGSSLARQAVKGEYELRLLAVLPRARRTGLGWKFLQASRAIAVAAGADRLVLDTADFNDTSQALYRKFGFVRRPERERLRAAPEPRLVVYTLDLS